MQSSQLVPRVEAIPLTDVPESLRNDEIRLTVHPRAEGVPAVHYLQVPPSPPRGPDLVGIVSLGIINSPDDVRIQEIRADRHRLALHVRIYKFEGRLAANVQRLALVIINLGDLSPGRYDGEVRVDRYVFSEYEHPETARFEGSSTYHVSVAGQGDG